MICRRKLSYGKKLRVTKKKKGMNFWLDKRLRASEETSPSMCLSLQHFISVTDW